MFRRIFLFIGAFAIVACLGAGCARQENENADITYSYLISRLTDTTFIARLDTPQDAGLVSSSDPSMQNKDHNHYVREGPKGWLVIADLRGPGYVSRFWCTGMNSNQQKIRFYFNDERRPRLETTLYDFFGGKDPFTPPLANREQGCWYSYLPIPYAERLVIMIESIDRYNDKPVMEYHHINYCTLPPDKTIQNFPKKLSEEHIKLLRETGRKWQSPQPTPASEPNTQELTLKASQTTSADAITGPAMIERLEITPSLSNISSAVEKEQLLRDIVLQASYDGIADKSISVPLGDFFGSFWRRTRFDSVFTGMKNDTFFSNLPIPFKQQAVFSFQNDSKHDIPIKLRTWTSPIMEWNGKWGYLHAGWNSSSAAQAGSSHTVLKTPGKGKLAGCILSVSSRDPSWWILESNEYIHRDGEYHASWRGTGLEDYFNGGWYYKNPAIRPLHGLTYMAPFQTIQYRFQLRDPFMFNTSAEMYFERGPGNRSKGDFESVAFYYLTKPSIAFSNIPAPEDRMPPEGPYEEATIVKQLINQERIGDMQGAHDHIDEFLEKHPDYPYGNMLRLRQIAYREEMLGFENVKSQYDNFIASNTDSNALDAAKQLLWYHQDPMNALLCAYCNAATIIYLDGQAIAKVDHPEMMIGIPIRLSPGKHTICIQAQPTRQQPWVLASLKTHQGNISTTPDWRCSDSPAGNIHDPDYDDTSWKKCKPFGKGPPEIPFVKQVPTALVNIQSQARGIRIGNWASNKKMIVFRRTFEIHEK